MGFYARVVSGIDMFKPSGDGNMFGVWIRRASLALFVAAPAFAAKVAPLYFESEVLDTISYNQGASVLSAFKLHGNSLASYDDGNNRYILDTVDVGGASKVRVVTISKGSVVAAGSQQSNWEKLMKYKLWGTHGLYLGYGAIHINDGVGYNGSAAGRLDMGNLSRLGGPTLIAGNVVLNHGSDSLTVGPFRTLSNLRLAAPDGSPFVKTEISHLPFEGNHCVRGKVSGFYNEANDFAKWKESVHASGGFTYNDGIGDHGYALCPDSVPEVDVDLTVPVWPEPSSWDGAENIDLVDSDPMGIDVAYIHVPPSSVESNDYGTYDKYINRIMTDNSGNNHLFVIMPPNGRLTRIFSKEGFLFKNNQFEIRVVYAQDESLFNKQTRKWDLSKLNLSTVGIDFSTTTASSNEYYKFVENDEYAGNLLFYTKQSFNFGDMNKCAVQGSWITTDTLTVGGNFNYGGQLIAKYVRIMYGVTGDFKYVPFDPPWLGNPEAKGWGVVKEGVSGTQKVNVALSKATSTGVTFKYCFKFKGDSKLTHSNDSATAVNGKYPYDAATGDVQTTGLPICVDGTDADGNYYSSSYKTSKFYEGESTLRDENGIYVTVVNDKDWEWTERFYIRIFDLEGAVSANGSRSDEYYVEIVDDDGVPLSNDFALTGNEDENLILNSFPAHRANGDTVKAFKVIIKELPAVGTLLLNGSAVKKNDVISYEDLGKLVFKGAANDFSKNGAEYDALKYTLAIYETNQVLDTTYTLSIVLNPVNDSPTKVVASDYVIAENSIAGTMAAGSIVVSDVDDIQFTYAFDKNDANYGKVSALFEISSGFKAVGNDTTNCILKLKNGATLDYESADSVMTIKVVITDAASTTNGAGKKDTSIVLTIRISDVNETPVSDNQSFVIDEHEKPNLVVGTIEWDDLDKDGRFRDNKVVLLEGDTSRFYISQNGVVTARTTFDYETEDTVYTYVVKILDVNVDSLFVIDTITIRVQNVPEYPVVTSREFETEEMPADSTVIGTLVSKDADDPKNEGRRVYSLADSSDYVVLTEDGKILVKDGSLYDFEKLDSFTISVVVADEDGNASVPAEVVIYLRDVNEAPSIKDTSLVVSESEKKGAVVGTVVATDPDFKTKDYSTLSFEAVDGDKDVFEVKSNGEIVLKGNLDYETRKEYSLVVRVSDGLLYDTAVVSIHVKNDPDEYTIVEIIEVKNDDSTWSFPDTIYTNDQTAKVTWLCEDSASVFDKTYTEGKNVIAVSCKDPSKDHAGSDTVIVFFSSAAPVITISAGGANVNADNIFTVVEQTAEKDTNIYVNSTLNDIYITVRDSFANRADTFVVKLDIVTFDVDKVKKVLPVAESEAEWPDVPDSAEVMLRTYTTKIDGKVVTISYWADAYTGIRTKVGKGDFFVSYDFKDEAGNVVNVSYAVDESGKIVANKDGDVGYTVSYSYTNRYGNSSTESVYITLDTEVPEVKITAPLGGDIIYTSFVEVAWTVNGVPQDTLVVQGLERGANMIVRYYKDKAGNVGADTVFVIMRNGKDVEISLVEPVVDITQDKLDKYYGSNPPKEGETFAVSVMNPSTRKEVETLIGGSFTTESGSGDVPYSGVSDGSHFGPTLSLDIKLPSYSAVGGMATLDELVHDGKIYPQGVVAYGKGNEPMTVAEYVAEYCEDDFDYSAPSKSNLYDSKLIAKIWVYTTLGNFVDYFSFTQDLNDPDFANDAGVLKLYFEQKPDKDGFVRAENGQIYATGAYVYKVEAVIKSTLRCDLPPLVKAGESGKRGVTRKDSPVKSSETLLKPFGYKRPPN